MAVTWDCWYWDFKGWDPVTLSSTPPGLQKGNTSRLWEATSWPLTAHNMKTFCPENRSSQAVAEANMAQAEALVLFSSLLTLCVSTGEWRGQRNAEPMRCRLCGDTAADLHSCLHSSGSPEVWVQVQRGPPELPAFLVRCGVSGSSLISLVTVSREGFVDAGGTKLAVLHPEYGTQKWAPTSQALWETPNSISLTLTLEQSEQSLGNTTFCCEFVTFPHGTSVACGALHSSDPGMSAVRRETGRTLTLAAHLIPFSVSWTLCPSPRPCPSSRCGRDLGNLGVPPVWFYPHTVSPVASTEALVRTAPGIPPLCSVSCLLA